MRALLVLFAFLVLTDQVSSGRRKPKLHGRFSQARLRVTGRWDIFAWINEQILRLGIPRRNLYRKHLTVIFLTIAITREQFCLS